MKKNFKRWLALLLAIIMVAGTCLTNADGSLRATNGEQTQQTEDVAADDTDAADSQNIADGTTDEDAGTPQAGETESGETSTDVQEIVIPKKVESEADPTGEGVTDGAPAEGQPTEGTSAEDSQVTEQSADTQTVTAPEDTQTVTYDVRFAKPELAGGVIRVWTEGEEKQEVTYDEENNVKKVTEGAALYFEIETTGNYQVSQVSDQNGNILAPESVSGNVSTYKVVADEGKEITTIYKEVVVEEPKAPTEPTESTEEQETPEETTKPTVDSTESQKQDESKPEEQTTEENKKADDKTAATPKLFSAPSARGISILDDDDDDDHNNVYTKEIKVGDTRVLNGGRGLVHNWSIILGEDRVKLETESSEEAQVTGIKPGTARIRHEYSGVLWTKQEFFDVTVTESTTQYNVYYYTLIPGKDLNSTGNADQIWNGMGVGSVTGVNAPETYPENTPISEGNHETPLSYPDIVVDGDSYQYAEEGSENAAKEGYYTIEWIRFIRAKGANSGNNGVNPSVDFNTPTFHRDGQIRINKENWYTIDFRVQEPNSERFTIQENYSKLVKSGTAESSLRQPSMDEKTVDGKRWKFDGWYTDEACTQKTKFQGTITSNQSYYGRYILAEDKLFYDANGGQGTMEATIGSVGGSVTVAENAYTRTGYEFKEWNTEADGTGTSYSKGEEYPLTTDRDVLYAQWNAADAMIVFDTNGGSEVASMQGKTDEAIEKRTMPITKRDGYDFEGWYANEDLTGNKVTELPEKFPAGTTTYYAKWSAPKEYTITYDLDGGALAEGVRNPVRYTVETDTIVLNNPSKAGYEFIGWEGTGLTEASKSVSIEKGSTGNREYTAKWKAQEATIQFETNGGSEVESMVGTTDKKIADQRMPTTKRDGYDFEGWYANEDLTEDKVTELPEKFPAGITTYYAKWSVPKEYKITYALDGGALAEGEKNPETYTVESDDITLINPTRAGYTFLGWTGPDVEQPAASVTIVKGSTGNRAYTAHWTADDSVIQFETNGGSPVASMQGKTDGALSPRTLPTTTKDGYTFEGWYANEDLTGDEVRELPATFPAGITTYYAKWSTPKVYHITYNLDGGTLAAEESNPETYTVETETFTLYNPTKPGYNFVGWRQPTETEASPNVTIEKGSTGDRTYNAIWTTRKDLSYTVKYVEKLSDGTEKSLSNDRVVNGCTFDETYTENAPTINGFKVDKTMKSIKIQPESNVITFYYTRRSYQYTVKYYDADPVYPGAYSSIHEEKKTKAPYETVIESKNEIIDITGYTFDHAEKESIKIGTTNNVIKLYYKNNNDRQLTVHHLFKNENGTETVLADPVTYENLPINKAMMCRDYKKDILKYEYDYAEVNGERKASIKLGADNEKNVIKLYYKKARYSYGYVHRDVADDHVIRPGESVTGAVADTEFTSDDFKQDFQGYQFYYATPDPMVIEPISITGDGYGNHMTLYYRRIDLNYTVEYYFDGEKDDERSVVSNEGVYGTLIPYTTNATETYNGKNYMFDHVDKTGDGTVAIDENKNIIRVYYVLDNNGPEEKPDGKPDSEEYKVTYLPNGGEGTVVDHAIYPEGYSVTAKDNAFTKAESVFAVWEKDGTEQVAEGEIFTMPANDVELEAQWKMLTVNKTASDPEDGISYKLGEVIEFTITVTNSGDVDLANVTVADELEGAVITAGEGYEVSENTAHIAVLPAGDTVNVKATYTVQETDMGNANFRNTATAEGEGTTGTDTTDPIPMNEVEKQITIAKELTNLDEATGTNGEEKAFALGDTMEFEIAVTNSGNQTLNNVEVEDVLEDAQIVKGEGYSVEGNKAKIAELDPKETITVNATYEVQEADLGNPNFRNAATAEAEDGTPGEGTTDPIPVEEEEPNVSVEKTVVDPQTEYEVGDTASYKIVVENNGNVTLENVVVEDILQGTNGEVTFAANDRVSIKGDVVTISRMVPGEVVTLECSYVITRADAGTALGNRVEVTTDHPDTTPKDDTTPTTSVEDIYTLTINYVYADGTTAAPSVVAQYLAGETFGYTSPTIEGYTPSAAFVRSSAAGMPANDFEYTVVYTADAAPIVPTPGTPDNQAPIVPIPGGTTPGGTTPGTPVTATPVTATPVTATPVTATPDVLTGVEITEDEDGNIEVTPVVDEEVPLANRDLDDHDCCVLHFLLMLAALIVYAAYTRSMKKRQARIAELAEELETEMLKRKQEKAE